MFSLAVFVSAMLDPRPSRSGAAAGRAHSDDGCDHLSYARARPHTIGSPTRAEANIERSSSVTHDIVRQDAVSDG